MRRFRGDSVPWPRSVGTRPQLVQLRTPVAGHAARRAGHWLVGGMVLRRRQFRAAAVHPVLGVAPEPRLARLEAPDQRVPGGGRVGAGVLRWRGVAAADVPAERTAAQVEPPAPGLVALGTARPARWDRRVDRFRGHLHTPLRACQPPDAAGPRSPGSGHRYWYSQPSPYPQTAAAPRTVTAGSARSPAPVAPELKQRPPSPRRHAAAPRRRQAARWPPSSLL